MSKRATRSTRLPVPREALLELGLTEEQIREAEKSAPLVHTPAPRGRHVEFDPARVAKVLRALRALRHTKTRRWAGKPLDPDPWQVVWLVAPVFGWVYSDTHPEEELAGTRVVRTVWCEVPRKAGKTTIASGFALALLAADDEPGAEVYSAAGGLAQARLVFDDSKKMALASPQLRGKVEALADVVKSTRNGGIYRAVSRAADLAHGLNVHGAIIDEVHVHKSRDLIDALETGTGARDQPLVLFITTADDGDESTIYAEKHNYTRQVADGTVKDPSHYGVIWAAEETDDPFLEATWRKANPGLGRSPTLAYLRKEAAKAASTPSYYPTFLRLHLNRRVRIASKWFDMAAWDEGLGLLGEPDLAGRDCYGGLDLASTSDFAAWVLLFPPREGDPDGGKWKVLPRLFLPRAALERRGPMRSQLLAWEKAGHLTVTEGDVADYDAIEARVSADATRYSLLEFAYDPWNATSLVQRLVDGGLVGWPLQQSIGKLNGPCKALERLVGKRQVNHGGHPVLRWMAANVVTRGDVNGNIAPDRKKSLEKIDGIAALVNAVAAATREREHIPEPMIHEWPDDETMAAWEAT